MIFSVFVSFYSSGDEECGDSDLGSNDGYDYGYEDDTEEKQFASEYFMKKKWAEKEASIRAAKQLLVKKIAGKLPNIGREGPGSCPAVVCG
jgi:hypothetical protein